MRERCPGDDQSHAQRRVAHDRGDDGAEQERQQQRANEPVGVWHVIEIERATLGEPRYDAELLYAGQHEQRPADIEPLHGEE